MSIKVISETKIVNGDIEKALSFVSFSIERDSLYIFDSKNKVYLRTDNECIIRTDLEKPISFSPISKECIVVSHAGLLRSFVSSLRRNNIFFTLRSVSLESEGKKMFVEAVVNNQLLINEKVLYFKIFLINIYSTEMPIQLNLAIGNQWTCFSLAEFSIKRSETPDRKGKILKGT